MAESPASQHRTNLIRQMARDLQNSRPISISSRVSDSNSNIDNESASSEFNPSVEGLGSTRNMDEQSQQLPNLRESSRPYNDRASATELDYRINTSALGRAFPNFSRSASERDEDSSRSIEVGRGYRGLNNNEDEHSSVVGRASHNQAPPAPGSKKEGGNSWRRALDSHRRSLEKEVSRASPPMVKATDYVSGGSRQSSVEKDRVNTAGEENVTQFGDDRPPTVNITSRSSRFTGTANAQASASTHLPKNFSSSKDFLRNLSRGGEPDRLEKQPNNFTATSQNTTQSYLIPDIPNISELISGTLEDGTPLFSRHTKARGHSGSTRFASHQGRKSRFDHYPIGQIAVPEEEEAIFVSLKVLQEKIASLETQKSEHQANIENLKEKNRALEAEKLARRRVSSRDSGIGHASGSDADDGYGHKSRKSVIERTRLESTIKTLQEKLEVSTKKVTTSEITIKNLSSERDSAISQLGVAFVNMEQLKVEKEQLQGENEALKAEIVVLRNQGRDQSSDARSDEYVKTRNNLERAVSRESVQTNRQDYTEILDIDANVHQHGDAATQHSTKGASISKMPKGRRKTRLVLEEYSETEVSEGGTKDKKSKSQKKANDKTAENATGRSILNRDETILSATGSSRFADLRQILEKARAVNRSQHEANHNVKTDRIPSVRPQVRDAAVVEPKLPKKSSMKSLKGQSEPLNDDTMLSRKENNTTKQSRASAFVPQTKSTSHERQTNRRRSAPAENMTSAFIIPDVTMRDPGEATIKLSQSAREVFDSLAQHDSQSCSICKRVIEHGVLHEHAETTKIAVPKPVPVSERMPSPGPGDDEPTMRPSQPPAVALATVIKNLEDEVKHLKIKESEYQALYLRHDPALSKRRRLAVFNKIQRLLVLIETKSNQVYALYDVLEGQKQSGQEMNEEEVEITLSRIGVDVQELGLRGGNIETQLGGDGSTSDASDEGSTSEILGRRAPKPSATSTKSGKRVKQVWDLESDDDDELPWEGFEITGDLTGRSGAARKRA